MAKITTLKEFPYTLQLMLGRPIRDSKQFFVKLATLIDKDVALTFRNEGKITGRKAWKSFSMRTLHPSWKAHGSIIIDHSKWNKRPGTDDSVTRRYSNNSKLLQASGGFKKMMTLPNAKIKLTNKVLRYGARDEEFANKIMSGGGKAHRPVLAIGSRELGMFRQLYKTWSELKIKS